jgi:hypothetical protein
VFDSKLPGMSQCLLILGTRTLNDFSEGVEHLTSNSDGFEEIGLAGGVNQFL